MKLIPCPLNGLRNVDEFAYGGDVLEMPAAGALDDAWTDYIFTRENKAGSVREWWFHVPTSYWFILERDTLTDTVIRSYPADQVFSRRIEFPPRSES